MAELSEIFQALDEPIRRSVIELGWTFLVAATKSSMDKCNPWKF